MSKFFFLAKKNTKSIQSLSLNRILLIQSRGRVAAFRGGDVSKPFRVRDPDRELALRHSAAQRGWLAHAQRRFHNCNRWDRQLANVIDDPKPSQLSFYTVYDWVLNIKMPCCLSYG